MALTTVQPQMAAGGPAFSASSSGTTSATTSTWTKIPFTVEEFDTNNNFASSTFTPTVAGYYQINSAIYFQNNALGAVYMRLYKNGSVYKDGLFIPNSNLGPNINISTLAYANGTTDYFEIYGWQSSGSTLTIGGIYFQGALVRTA